MKAYYAHPLSLYNTPQEKRDIQTLEALGFEVLNPNGPEHDAGYKRAGMDYFVELVKDCNVCAFRAFPDGSIPAGIAKEVHAFTSTQRPVIELPNALTRRTLSVDETREYLREVGNR